MDVRIRTDQRFLASITILLAWVAATGLLMAWQGNLRGAIPSATGHLARANPIGGIGSATALLWLEHSSLVILSLIAATRRRADIMGLLLIGPAIAFAVAFGGERWFDPGWSKGMLNSYSIGWLMSLIVGAEYWCLFPDSNPAK